MVFQKYSMISKKVRVVLIPLWHLKYFSQGAMFFFNHLILYKNRDKYMIYKEKEMVIKCRKSQIKWFNGSKSKKTLVDQ